MTDAALQREVEETMRKAHNEDAPNCECGFVWLKPAASVAVVMIEEERRKTQGALEQLRDAAMLNEKLYKRAEAAEKALAERGHVAGCNCTIPDGRFQAYRDKRCAPGAER